MIDNAERLILEKFLIAGGVVLDCSPPDQALDETIRTLKPKLRLHVLPRAQTIAGFCAAQNIPRLALVHLHGDELAAIRCALPLLRGQRIDLIRFHLPARASARAHESLFDLTVFLQSLGFLLMMFRNGQATLIPRIVPSGKSPAPQAMEKISFLAVAPRLLAMLAAGSSQKKNSDSLIHIRALFAALSLTPRGVVHVGAHDAEELNLYKRMGFRRILFIEANPDLAQKIREKTVGDPSVMVSACAAADVDGTVTLHITSADQSSSILPLKLHQTYYPDIRETRQVTVAARRLDTLLAELQLSAADFNYLHLDIQGAELKALRGATDLLAHIEALTSEVNYEELYEGCGLIDELETLLSTRGFQPHTITSPYHASWGDAFYIRPKEPPPPDPSRGLLTCNTLGRNGRFANQLFQYAFLRIVAQHHGLIAQTPPWIGQELFGHRDPQPAAQLPMLCEGRDWPDAVFPRQLFDRPLANRDLWGYFQFDTAFYAPYQAFFRALFQPVATIREPLQQAVARLLGPLDQPRSHTLVALHIRRGDYKEGLFFPAPAAWYHDWLSELWPTLSNPILYIASDEIGKVLPEFARYHPLTAADLDVTIPASSFYPDFYMLAQADILAISNSSFSFLPAMLNERNPRCVRPNQHLARLIPFDPWSAPPLLHRDMGTPIIPPAMPAPSKAAPPGVQLHGRTNTGAPIISFNRPKPP